MTHKICISLDKEAWDILSAMIDSHNKSGRVGYISGGVTASAVVRAGLDALADDCLALHRIDEVMRRRWR